MSSEGDSLSDSHEANAAARTRAEKSGYLRDVQVYEPHRVGLPPLVPYFRELWNRREFAAELSRAETRSSNSRTFFGQIWLVINPLLLAVVYFFLVYIIGRSNRGVDFLVHLIAGIFAYYFLQGAITTGARSVVGGGAIIANMAFPRLLMPLASVRTALVRFVPTIVVYFILHLITRQPLGWQTLLSLYFLACMMVFSAGMAAIFATLQVYFRDTTSFLPYFMRLWLYMSPVLWFAEDAQTHMPHIIARFLWLNPLYSILGGWTDLLVRAQVPSLTTWLISAVWAIGAAVAGSLFFMSREREFAVRL